MTYRMQSLDIFYWVFGNLFIFGDFTQLTHCNKIHSNKVFTIVLKRSVCDLNPVNVEFS